jgi:hypothetical protein
MKWNLKQYFPRSAGMLVNNSADFPSDDCYLKAVFSQQFSLFKNPLVS